MALARPSRTASRPAPRPRPSRPAPPRQRAGTRAAPSRPSRPAPRPAATRPAPSRQRPGTRAAPRPQQGRGRPSRPATRWDYTVVQRYLPPRIAEENPIHHHEPQRPLQGYQPPPQPFTPADRRDQAQRGQPYRPFAERYAGPPPTAVEARPYPQAPYQPTPTATGWGALGEELQRHGGEHWQQGQAAVQRAGQGQYVEIWPKDTQEEKPWGLSGMFYNIGQSPIIGKPLTALWESAKLVGTVPAESIERTLGHTYYTSTGDPTRRRLGIDGDPVKEQAWQAALGVTYSGPKAVENAYKDALELAQQNQLSPENAELVQARHGVWWKEALGQVILDPLNFVGGVGLGAKAPKMTKWTKGATRLFVDPWKAGDRLVETSEVLTNINRAAQRGGQVAAAENLLDEALVFVNPRFTSTINHKLAERASQMVDIMAGVANKMSKVHGVQPAEAFQDIAMNWAKLASDNLDEVEEAARVLGQMGFESGPTSKVGRVTGVMLDRLMRKSNGEFGDLTEILKVARADNLPVEAVASKFYEKALKVVEGIVEPQKWEKGLPQRAAKAVLSNKYRRAADSFYANMFMGLSPGYAMRNFMDNTARTLVNGYSPFKPLAHLDEQVGLTVRAERHLVGQAEGTAQMPFARIAEKLEQWGGRRVLSQAQMDTLNQRWPDALSTVPDLPQNMGGVFRGLIKQPINAIDDLVGKQVDNWRVLDDASIDAMNQIDPQLHGHVVELLSKAKTPEEALAGIRGMQGKYAQHIAEMTEKAKPMGPAMGTMAGHAAEMLKTTGKVKLPEIEELAGHLGKLEFAIKESRNRAVVQIQRTIDPDQWLAMFTKSEETFERAMWQIRDRQLKGYVKMIDGDITPKQYADGMKKLYAQAQTELNDAYTKIIRGAGGPTLSADNPTPLLRWLLQREGVANKATSAAVKQGADELGHATEAAGKVVPNPHLLNKVKKILQGDAGASTELGGRLKSIRSINDLTNDELATAINGLRKARDPNLPDMTLEQMIQTYANKVPEITLRDFDPLRAVPEVAERSPELARLHLERDELFVRIEKLEEGLEDIEDGTIYGQRVKEIKALEASAEKLDNAIDDMSTALDAEAVQRLAARTTDPSAKAALGATQAAGAVGPSPDMLDSVFYAAKEGTALLDNLADDVMQRAANPTIIGQVITPEQALRLKQLYTETHTLAAEVARRARDFTLLDYSDRRYLDPLIKVIYPWHYWWSRSVPNWAASLAANPAMVAHYMNFKKELKEYNDNDPNIPEWAKDKIALQPPGYPGKMYWDFDAAFNAVGNIFDNFDNPAARKNMLGEIINKLGTVGPAPHPLLMLAYAAEQGLVQGDEEGARALGYIAPITRTFASITGKTLEPWLWAKDPGTGERIPWAGGTQWDIEKARRKLASEQATGRFGAEEATLGAATGAGDAFLEVLTNDIADYRRLPTLLSFALGLRVTPRQDWEVEMQTLNTQYSEMLNAGNREGAQALLGDHPELSTLWFSWDNEAARMRMLANNVFARIPPMPGDSREKLLQSVGLNPILLEQFYETTRDNKQALSDWDRRDYDQLVDGVIDLAEVLKIPDKKTAAEWRDARATRQQMEEALGKRFPNATQQNDVYWAFRQAGDDEGAREYLASTPTLSEYWNAKNKYLVANPVLVKYYQQPEKVDQMAESFAREQLLKRYPDYYENRSAYFDIPEDDWKARREFRRQHPEVSTGEDEYREYLQLYREQLTDLRAYSQSEPGIATHIIDGKPNAAQRALLRTIEALERDVAAEVPLPEEEPANITPEQRELYQARDTLYAQLTEQFPQYPDLDREYDQIKYVYGQEAATIFGQQSGLFDIRDQERIMSMQHPILMREMSDDDVKYTAQAVMRVEANQMWPGLDQSLDQYYALDKAGRKKYGKEHPEVYAYFDWKDGAEQHFTDQLTQRRAQFRQQTVVAQEQQPATGGVVSRPGEAREPGTIEARDLAEAIRLAESGGDYAAKNPASSASGAYQYIDSTWSNYEGYARAADAPQEIQDQRMLEDIRARAAKYNNDIEKVIAAHYYPKWANDPSQWNKSPAPGQPTVRAYVDSVLRRLRE